MATARGLKVLLSNPTMHRVGTWYRAYYLGQALAKRGHDVTLLNVSPDSHFKVRAYMEAGIHIVEMPRLWGQRWGYRNTRLPSDLVGRALFIGRNRFDVLHLFTHHFNAVMPGVVERMLGRDSRLVLDWDDLWTDGGLMDQFPRNGPPGINYRIDRWCEHNLKRFCDGVTVVSHDLMQRALDDGMPRERVRMIPNGAAIDRFSPGDKRAMRQKLGLPLDGKIAIFSGAGQYDLDMIMDAVKLLPDGEKPLVTICGPNPDIAERMARERGLFERVKILGMLSPSSLNEQMTAADVGLMPYADKPLNRARWPIKVGDYLAAALPIVTCRVGEVGRLVEEHRVGIATSPDAHGFSQGLRTLLHDGNPEMARRARKLAEDTSWDSVAAMTEQFYAELVEREQHFAVGRAAS